MRTLLICHEGDDLDRVGLARWLASFSDLVGVVAIREPRSRLIRRLRREIRRVGALRFLDVLAFHIVYGATYGASDRKWVADKVRDMRARYPVASAPELLVSSPNSIESENFIRSTAPDMVIARCKSLLAERIYSIPPIGTFVMHPGICPEYRNAHGCFWAIVRRDLGRVGMTVLKIDKGVDTGPVYGYFHYDGNPADESPMTIQHRVVFDNLIPIQALLTRIMFGEAEPVATEGRASRTWGQPWLSTWLRWKCGGATK